MDPKAGDVRIIRRLQPGTKSKEFYKWPDEELDQMESTLAVQQYLQQKIRADYTDIEGILELPPKIDVNVWNYEHLRQFCNQLNELCVMLQPECNAETCDKMMATASWIFLCAVHKEPKECCAIDYIRHTLDGSTNILNSNRYFPSRINLKDSSVAKLPSTCRRVYRIFSHAYFHHRAIYDDFEERTMLCHRFDRWVNKFDLIQQDLLIVPLNADNTDNNSDNSDGDGYATLINSSVIENIKQENSKDEDECLYETVVNNDNSPNNQIHDNVAEGKENDKSSFDVIDGEEENDVDVKEVPESFLDDDDDDDDQTLRE